MKNNSYYIEKYSNLTPQILIHAEKEIIISKAKKEHYNNQKNEISIIHRTMKHSCYFYYKKVLNF